MDFFLINIYIALTTTLLDFFFSSLSLSILENVLFLSREACIYSCLHISQYECFYEKLFSWSYS